MARTFRTAGLGLMALSAFALTVLPARNVRSQDDKQGGTPSPIEGAWKLVESKNGDAQDYQKPPEGTEMIKYVTGGRFVWTVVREARIIAAAGGKYTVAKNKYTESIEYVHGEGQASLVGKTFDFTWKVDGTTWLHVGTIKVDDRDLKIDEKWERCK
jgi:hypothetical protein